MSKSAMGEDERREHFIDALASFDEGNILLFNMEAGLRLGWIDAKICTDFLNKCAEALTEAVADNSAEVWQTFQRTAKLKEFQFIRTPMPAIGVKVALALRAALLYDESIGFLSLEGQRALEDAGLQLDQLDKPVNQTELLRKLKTGSILKKDASLGAPGVLVWATRADDKWRTLASECERSHRADRARDYLGLPHAAGQVYFELRSREELDHYCCNGRRRVAAPTAFDASTHSRFKQEADSEQVDDWNRAIDLDLAFLKKATNADGAPELVLERLGFQEVEWISCLGVTDRDAPGLKDHSAFIDRLANSRRAGRRTVEEVARSIKQRLDSSRVSH